MHRHRLADDQSIGYQFADCLPGVGVGDFVDFIRIEPDFALTTANHGGSEALLSAEVDPIDEMGILARCNIR